MNDRVDAEAIRAVASQVAEHAASSIAEGEEGSTVAVEEFQRLQQVLADDERITGQLQDLHNSWPDLAVDTRVLACKEIAKIMLEGIRRPAKGKGGKWASISAAAATSLSCLTMLQKDDRVDFGSLLLFGDSGVVCRTDEEDLVRLFGFEDGKPLSEDAYVVLHTLTLLCLILGHKYDVPRPPLSPIKELVRAAPTPAPLAERFEAAKVAGVPLPSRPLSPIPSAAELAAENLRLKSLVERLERDQDQGKKKGKKQGKSKSLFTSKGGGGGGEGPQGRVQ